jgi:fermentation-respiration switch protein FrsA (DUF1100 family)
LHRSINGVILQFPSESTKLKGEEMKNVTFPNGPIKMAGDFHLPKDFSEDRRYVAIVWVHPAGGVKEQTAGLYAAKLAEEGRCR